MKEFELTQPKKLEVLTPREYLRAIEKDDDGSKQKIFEPIVSALVSLKNIEIEQMNTRFNTSKDALSNLYS